MPCVKFCALGFIANGSKGQLWKDWINVVQWLVAQWPKGLMQDWRWKRGANEGLDKARRDGVQQLLSRNKQL